MNTLQKSSFVHAAFYTHFNQDRRLFSRDTHKPQRSAALIEWKTVAA